MAPAQGWHANSWSVPYFCPWVYQVHSLHVDANTFTYRFYFLFATKETVVPGDGVKVWAVRFIALLCFSHLALGPQSSTFQILLLLPSALSRVLLYLTLKEMALPKLIRFTSKTQQDLSATINISCTIPGTWNKTDSSCCLWILKKINKVIIMHILLNIYGPGPSPVSHFNIPDSPALWVLLPPFHRRHWEVKPPGHDRVSSWNKAW